MKKLLKKSVCLFLIFGLVLTSLFTLLRVNAHTITSREGNYFYYNVQCGKAITSLLFSYTNQDQEYITLSTIDNNNTFRLSIDGYQVVSYDIQCQLGDFVLLKLDFLHDLLYFDAYRYNYSTMTYNHVEFYTFAYPVDYTLPAQIYIEDSAYMCSSWFSNSDYEPIDSFAFNLTPFNSSVVNNNNAQFYSDGYSLGYNTGYDDALTGNTVISPFFNVMSSLFNGISDVMNIEIVPHVTLWYFIAVPLFFVIVFAILKIWRHN